VPAELRLWHVLGVVDTCPQNVGSGTCLVVADTCPKNVSRARASYVFGSRQSSRIGHVTAERSRPSIPDRLHGTSPVRRATFFHLMGQDNLLIKNNDRIQLHRLLTLFVHVLYLTLFDYNDVNLPKMEGILSRLTSETNQPAMIRYAWLTNAGCSS
jgi:hypothetical protein